MLLNSSLSAVVSGGASGLGEATARALAARDVRVTIFDMNRERGEAIAAEIGGIFAMVNVADEGSIDEGYKIARKTNGQERILVNCAGIAPGAKTVRRDKESNNLTPHSLSLFASVINVNLIGTFNCIVKSSTGMVSLPPLDDGERGAIICTSSIAAEDGQIGQAGYSASKAGIVGMTLPIARDLMADGVRINTILPGLFETPMMKGLPKNVQDTLGASVPFPKRLGRASEYASLALFLLEEVYMNGATVRLDAAMRLGPR